MTPIGAAGLNYGRLGEEGGPPQRTSLRVFVVACALAAGVMLGVAVTGLGNSGPAAPAASETSLLSVGALPKMRGGLLGGPRASDTFRAAALQSGALSSPLAKVAMRAIEVNNRGNRRDVSMQVARQELKSGWDLVDSKVREKLLKKLDTVEYKSSLLAGVTAPMDYFDPIGFSTTVTSGKLLFYREVELKHGRVAMLAALGILVGESFHPLFGGDIDVPAVFAFQQTPLETFWPAVLAAVAIPEIYSVFSFQDPSKGEQWAIREDHEPGNLGFDPLGLKPTDEKELVAMKTKELNNGRLAMIAVAGMVAQEIVTGQKLFS